MSISYLSVLILSCFFSISLSECQNSRRRLISKESEVDFIVALQVPLKNQIHDKLLDISNPKSLNYGQYLSLDAIRKQYGPTPQVLKSVSSYFEAIPDAKVEIAQSGDMLKVTASVLAIEDTLNTELHLHECEIDDQNAEEESSLYSKTYASQQRKLTKRSHRSHIRSYQPILLPEGIKEHVAFISLDIPTSYMTPHGKTYDQITTRNEHRRYLENVKHPPHSESNSDNSNKLTPARPYQVYYATSTKYYVLSYTCHTHNILYIHYILYIYTLYTVSIIHIYTLLYYTIGVQRVYHHW